jgi:hypothetical protein
LEAAQRSPKPRMSGARTADAIRQTLPTQTQASAHCEFRHNKI